MGLTLDAVWRARLRDSDGPVVANVIPAAGSTVPSLKQIQIQFNEGVQGVDAADLLINGVAATNLSVVASNDYVFRFSTAANRDC